MGPGDVRRLSLVRIAQDQDHLRSCCAENGDDPA
jgi:hypothetical protein